MAMAFMKQEAIVVCADRGPASKPSHQPPTHELIQQDGGKSTFVETDVGDEKSMRELVRKATEAYGRLDM